MELVRALGADRILPMPPKHDQETVGYFKELLGSGAFSPVIDRRYPLDRIVEGYRYVETGRKIGTC
jgi:NADPH:quinone reductase-like Zn-dependent oxidoreductase